MTDDKQKKDAVKSSAVEESSSTVTDQVKDLEDSLTEISEDKDLKKDEKTVTNNSSSKVGTKRRRASSSQKPSGLVDLGEDAFQELFDKINDSTVSDEQLITYLEILGKFDATIDYLQNAKAGLGLKQLKKNRKHERVQQLCKNLITYYKSLVLAEIEFKKQKTTN